MLRKYVALLLVASAPLALADSEGTEWSRLVELNAAGEPAAAYRLAEQLRERWEGDTAFDLPYAIAAIDSGHINEGIFALQRVLLQRPDLAAARLELARAYFLLGQDALAQQQFVQVAQLNPPPDVQRRIDAYMARIEQRAHAGQLQSSGYLRFGAGYDTNVNSGPDRERITLPGGTVTLNDATGEEDLFTAVALGGLVHKPLTKSWSGFVEARGGTRLYQDQTALDHVDLGLASGVLWRSRMQQVRVSVNGQRYWLDDASYRDLYGASLDYTYALHPNGRLGGYLARNRLDYDTGTRDSDMTLLGINASWQFGGNLQPLLYASLYRGWERPRQDTTVTAGSVERDLTGGHLGLNLQASSRLTAGALVVAQHSDYAGPYQLLGPVTSVDRRDHYTALQGHLQWQLTEAVATRLEYTVSQNDSNSALLEYDRRQVELSLEYRF